MKMRLIEPSVKTDHDFRRSCRVCINETLRLLKIFVDRFFAKDILIFCQGSLHEVDVSMGGRANVNSVYFFVLNYLIRQRREFGPKFTCQTFSCLVLGVTYCFKASQSAPYQISYMNPSNSTRSNHRDIYHSKLAIHGSIKI